MKKIYYILMAFTAMAITVTSCSKDIESDIDVDKTPVGKVAITFSATQETSGTTTRTVLAAGNKVNWQSDDKVTIWDGKEMNVFTVAPDATDPTLADISGEVCFGSTSFMAVYPNSVGENCTFTANAINNIVIPATQTATANTFDPKAAVMVAETTVENGVSLAQTVIGDLTFKHVCLFLKLTTEEAYEEIEVSVTEGNIAGTFSVVPSTGVATATEGVKTITLVPEGSATSIAAGTYYIAMAPGEVTNFTIRCYSANKYIEKTKSGSFTFARLKCLDMGTPSTANRWSQSPYEYVNLGLSVRWAKVNLGAANPQDCGIYYAWGATSGCDKAGTSCSDHVFNYANAPFNNGNSKSNYAAWMANKSSAIDSNKNLLPANDAAHTMWGGIWRMPTQAELIELIDNCYWEYTSNYNETGMPGYIVYKVKNTADKGLQKYSSNTVTTTASYSLSDTHIFFPFAGCREGKYAYLYKGSGYYWTSTFDENSEDIRINARGLYLSTSIAREGVESSYYGRTIRAVCP